MIVDCDLNLLNIISNISNIILLDNIATINFDFTIENDSDYGYQELTEEQLKVNKYKLTSDGVKAILNFLKNCSEIKFNNYNKSTKFMNKYGLTETDCLEIIHNLKLEDYYANTRSFIQGYGGNNLIIFEPAITKLSNGKIFNNLTIYIKIDLDETTNEAVALVSIYDGEQNNLPYINGDFDGIVEDYYLYENYDDTIYDFLAELLEDTNEC